MPAQLLAIARRVLAGLRDPSSPLLPFIPKSLKILFLLLILINSPSLPFLWHYRVWKYPLQAYWNIYTKGRKGYLDRFEQRSAKAGGATMRTKLKRIAWFDDCDYNLHLSNSAYAKNGDAARMQWAIEALAPAFTPEIHMAMGASHYIFIKEIPIGTEYVMETRCGGWDEKWVYLVTEYIIYPKKNRLSKTTKGKPLKPDSAPTGPVVPAIVAPEMTELTRESTPDVEQSRTPSPNAMEDVKHSAALRSRLPRSDGGVVCCVSVLEYCFKQGRVTVPPRIAMHIGMTSADQADRDLARNIILKNKDRGVAYVRGGWKTDQAGPSIGSNIGKEAGEGSAFPAGWAEKGKKGMDLVNQGLGVF